MKNKIYLFVFIPFLFCTSSLFGQIEKGSWQIGLSGAPLFETSNSSYQGSLFTANVDYSLTKRLSLGLMPFYGYIKSEGSMGIDPITMQSWGIWKDNFKSVGINLNLKFYIINSNKIKPYLTVVAGLGSTTNNYSRTDQTGDIQSWKGEPFKTLNLGVGVGASFKISKSLYIDSKVMYMSVGDFANPSPIKFVYPSIGIIKTFQPTKK